MSSKRKRQYAAYDDESIEKAKKDVAGGMSLQDAALTHGLKRQTLKNKISNKHSSSFGRPQELTEE